MKKTKKIKICNNNKTIQTKGNKKITIQVNKVLYKKIHKTKGKTG